MSEGSLPPNVELLIAKHIDSVVRLEVLLYLFERPGPQFPAHLPDAVARELRIESAWAAAQLEELRLRGLAAPGPNGPPEYVYAPSTPALAQDVRDLARAFTERRVAVISAIYSQPPDPLRSLSDAFLLRKPRPPGEKDKRDGGTGNGAGGGSGHG